MRKTFCHTKCQGVCDKNIFLLKYKNFCFFFNSASTHATFDPLFSLCVVQCWHKKGLLKNHPRLEKKVERLICTHIMLLKLCNNVT